MTTKLPKGLIEAARTLTRTSPSAGLGSGSSWTEPGAPNVSNANARITQTQLRSRHLYFNGTDRGGGDAQNRTGDGGFADLCLTTWLRRHQAQVSILPLGVAAARLSLAMPNQAFRDAMARLPAGVVVVSARSADEYRGLTASSLVSVSLEP